MHISYPKIPLVSRQIYRRHLFGAFIDSRSGLKTRMQHFVWALVLLQLTFSGCASVNDIIKAEPAPNAGFLPTPELLSEMRERYPFHGAWMNSKVEDFHAYKSIYVAPIDTSHIMENGWWEKANLSGGNLEKDAASFAHESEAIFRQSLLDSIKLSVVDTPEPGSLVLELSIVELTPAKVWLSVIGLAAFVVPIIVGIPAGTAAALGQNGIVAIEGILRDSDTGEILLMFADREASKIRILDLQTLTWYGHAHEIMEDWAHQLIELLTTSHDHMVSDSNGFAWLPF